MTTPPSILACPAHFTITCTKSCSHTHCSNCADQSREWTDVVTERVTLEYEEEEQRTRDDTEHHVTSCLWISRTCDVKKFFKPSKENECPYRCQEPVLRNALWKLQTKTQMRLCPFLKCTALNPLTQTTKRTHQTPCATDETNENNKPENKLIRNDREKLKFPTFKEFCYLRIFG